MPLAATADDVAIAVAHRRGLRGDVLRYSSGTNGPSKTVPLGVLLGYGPPRNGAAFLSQEVLTMRRRSSKIGFVLAASFLALSSGAWMPQVTSSVDSVLWELRTLFSVPAVFGP